MNNKRETEGPLISEVEPLEVVGRDTIARFQSQFRAAAYSCLSILSGKTIDRVYCDHHDDFVCRQPKGGKPTYHFYQVKTKSKKNFQWGKMEVLGLPKKKKPKPEQIAGSFAGKLMMHTIRFKNSCGNVVFLTNVQFDDELEDVSKALATGDFSNSAIKVLLDGFNDALVEGEPMAPEAIKEKIGRLLLKSGEGYLHPHDNTFEALAREAIFQYSEVDLQHVESEEIIKNLVALVEKKSFNNVIEQLSEADLDDAAGIGIADLLEILSISKGAYRELLEGGDPQAVRNASIIQRKLKSAGASETLIEYCSKWKVSWDVWFRDKRHTLPEFDLNFLLEDLNAIKNGWAAGQIGFADLQTSVDALWAKISGKGMTVTLSKDLLVGGVFSALVRSEA